LFQLGKLQLFHSAQFKQILQITVQQHSHCLHHIIAHTTDTNKHPMCTALAATKSLHKYGVCHPHYWCCI